MALTEAPASDAGEIEGGCEHGWACPVCAPTVDESECLWCSTPLGREVICGVLYPEVGIVGFVHLTGCSQYYAEVLDVSPFPPKLVVVA